MQHRFYFEQQFPTPVAEIGVKSQGLHLCLHKKGLLEARSTSLVSPTQFVFC